MPARLTPAHLGFIGVLGILLVALAGLTLRVIALNQPIGADLWWHDLLSAHRTSSRDAVALALNLVGGTLWMSLITLAISVGLLIARRWRAAITVALTVAAASGICSLIKLGVSRPRPPGAVIDVVSDSFPSGHTTTAAALAVALTLLLRRIWVGIAAGTWIVAMAFSRTYLSVHWMSDVVAGAALGLSAALLVHAVVGEIARFMRERTRGGAPLLSAPPAGADILSA